MGEEKRIIGFDELWELITDPAENSCRNCAQDREVPCNPNYCQVWKSLEVPVRYEFAGQRNVHDPFSEPLYRIKEKP